MATLLSTDTFDRADSTNAPGSTDGSGRKDSLAWSTLTGTVGINSNQIYATGTSGVGAAIGIDLGTHDIDISLTIATTANSAGGIVFRSVDTQNFWVWGTLFSQGMCFNKVTGGSNGQFGPGFTAASNGDVLRLVCRGPFIYGYRNGTLISAIQDNYCIRGTVHGVHIAANTTPRFDNWSAQTVDPPHTYSILTESSSMSVSSQPWIF